MARYLVAILALGFVLLSVGCRLLPWFALGFLGEKSVLRSTVTGTVALSAAVGLTLVLLRWRPQLASDRLQLLPRRLVGALVAMLVGGAMFALVYAAVRLLGGIQVSYIGGGAGHLLRLFAVVLLATLLNAAWEEYTFRGWPFSVCVQAFGPHTVALTLGTLFGLFHLLNPSWTVPGIVSVAIAGWLISYTMLAFGDIAVPIGLHVGWNLTQSMLMTRRVWRVVVGSSTLLSGGDFGLEASLPGIAVTALAALASLGLFRRRWS